MKILSLFDGISIAQQAFKELGYEVEYYASEIDKYAIQITQKNHPNTEQLGDVKDIDCTNGNLHFGKGKLSETDIYFLIGGSPCQDLSISKKDRKGLDGEQSSLFWEYVRILKELKPKYFVFENVFSMGRKERVTITRAVFDLPEDEWECVDDNVSQGKNMKFKNKKTGEIINYSPVLLNAAKLSAQNRKRLFWVGSLQEDGTYKQVNIPQPADRNIYLKDILENNEAVKEKTYCLTTRQKDFINDFIKRHQGDYVFKNKPIRIGSIGKGGQGCRIYSVHGKSVCLSANGGGGAKTGLYLITGDTKRTRVGKGKTLEIRKDEKLNSLAIVPTDSLVVLEDYFRPLTPIECERLQSLPDGYSEGLSKTVRKKLLGNGFNCLVVKHILENML